jgi:hypothetical protein
MGEDGGLYDIYSNDVPAVVQGPARLRALAVDLDMTTLDSKGILPARNREALGRYREEHGGPLVVATGRKREGWTGGNMSMPAAVEGAGQIGDAVTHVVCHDGGVVMERDPEGKGDGWRTTICNMRSYPDAARMLRRIAGAFPPESAPPHFGIFPPSQNGQILAEEGMVKMLGLNPRYPKMMLNNRPQKLVPCVRQALRNGYQPPLLDPNRMEDTAVGFIYIVPSQLGVSADELTRLVQPLLEQEAKETGVCWKPWSSSWRLDPEGNPVTKNWPNLDPATAKEGTGAITLFQSGVSKQTALAQLGDQFGMGQEGKGWMAFGDTTNDLEMLGWAEWSIAPANAKNPKAKEAAKEVSEFTNDECCVGRAVERALGGSRRGLRGPAAVEAAQATLSSRL